MEVGREKLFAAIVPEENDASLATFQELARKLASEYKLAAELGLN